MHRYQKSTLFFLLLLFLAGLHAQDRAISRDSLEVLHRETFDLLYAYDFKNALIASNELVEVAKNQKDDYYTSLAYTRVAYTYTAMKDTINGLLYFQKSLEYAKKTKQDTIVSVVYNDMGNMYMEVGGNLEKAIDNFKKSLALNIKGNRSYKGLLANYINLAWTENELRHPEKALPYIQNVYEIINGKNLHPLYYINTDTQYGRYLYLIGNYEAAIRELLRATTNAEAGGFLNEAVYAQHFLSEAYEANGDQGDAIESLKKEIALDSDLHEKMREQQVLETSAKYKLEQYQNEIEQIKKEQVLADQLSTKSRQLTTVFIITSVVLLLATIAAFLLYRNRKKYLKDLNIKNKELVNAKNEAERLSKLKTQFFSTVSHELRTPLYGVIGLSSILLEDEGLTSHKEDLKSLKFSADYLLALINDVLTLNKADANGMQLEKSPFKLSLLVNNITDSFSFSLQQNNNKMNVVIDESIPDNMLGDSIKLSQILMNLVGNAVKFNENGTIEIIIKLLEKTIDGAYRVQFFIKDNGIGIPKEKQTLIFEEFSQVENNNYNYQGTGLGLPIVKKLLAIYNSEIDLKSEVGSGSIFSFILDLEQNVSQIEGDFEQVTQNTLDNNSSFENVHILIVDDNKINQKVTQKILQSKHFSTSLADDGIQAVTMVQQNNYGLILMDIHMPNMGGVEATKAIRNFNKHIPIIALTAVEIEEARENMIEAGMDDIILKPYDVSQFLTTIFRNLTPKIISK